MMLLHEQSRWRASQPPFLCSLHEVEHLLIFYPVLCAGFNCAEAVNFGPPDWLPYGSDRAQKYRGDMKVNSPSNIKRYCSGVGDD